MNSTLKFFKGKTGLNVARNPNESMQPGCYSLARMKYYPINELKTDRSFVDDLTDRGQDLIIAQTIIAMSKSLGFTVVAEGVETAEQLDI